MQLAAAMDLSVIVPIHNELENIPLLHERVTTVLQPTGLEFGLVLVDDGSKDGSTQLLRTGGERQTSSRD